MRKSSGIDSGSSVTGASVASGSTHASAAADGAGLGSGLASCATTGTAEVSESARTAARVSGRERGVWGRIVPPEAGWWSLRTRCYRDSGQRS